MAQFPLIEAQWPPTLLAPRIGGAGNVQAPPSEDVLDLAVLASLIFSREVAASKEDQLGALLSGRARPQLPEFAIARLRPPDAEHLLGLCAAHPRYCGSDCTAGVWDVRSKSFQPQWPKRGAYGSSHIQHRTPQRGFHFGHRIWFGCCRWAHGTLSRRRGSTDPMGCRRRRCNFDIARFCDVAIQHPIRMAASFAPIFVRVHKRCRVRQCT